MSVITQLATSLNRRDEEPNIHLAKKIVARADQKAVAELIACLQHKDKNIRHDCIKVLYEAAAIQPALIAPYYKRFLELLETGSTRMLWGAMTALDYVAQEIPGELYKALPKIVSGADKDSVIARDHAVGIFAKLSSKEQYAGKAFPALIRQLLTCPLNQLPMYAEIASVNVLQQHKQTCREALLKRLPEVVKESQRKRLMKVLRNL